MNEKYYELLIVCYIIIDERKWIGYIVWLIYMDELKWVVNYWGEIEY